MRRIAVNVLLLIALFSAGAGMARAFGPEGRIERVDGAPMLCIDGRPTVPMADAIVRVWLDPTLANPMLGETRLAAQAGLHLHVIETARRGLPWPEKFLPQEYEYLDRLMDAVLTRDLEARVLIRLDATFVPEDWAKDHPAEMAADSDGQKLGWPSLASKAWRDGLREQIRGFCDHLRGRPYAPRILGFVVDGMHLGQWRYQSLATADHSATGVADWRDWLRKRYGGEEALRAAWGDAQATFDSVKPPEDLPAPDEERAADFLHLLNPADPLIRARIDYRTYSSERIAETVDQIAGWFKDYSNGRLVGVGYGYTMELATADDFPALGHYDLARLLASPHVDMIIAPYSYDGRNPRSFGPHAPGPAEAVREAGKLLVCQDDMRTHLAPPGPLRFAGTMNESLALIQRDVGRALVGAEGHWFFEPQGQGSFNALEMWKAREQMQRIYQDAIDKRELAQAPELAVVVDEDSIPYFAESPELALPLLFDQRGDFARAGVAHGTYLFSRLEDIPRSVRVYFFLNAFAVDEARAAKVRRFLDERKGVAVWLFAPGVIQPSGFSARGAAALTGLPLSVATQATTHSLNLNALPNSPVLRHIRELPPARTPPLGPTVYAAPNAEGCVTLAPYDVPGSPGALVARPMEGGWVSVFCALPRPGIGLIRGLSEYAGAHVWTDSSDLAVQAGGSFLSVNCAKSGRYEFRLPRPADAVVDLLRAAPATLDGPRADRFSADLKAGEYSLFYVQ